MVLWKDNTIFRIKNSLNQATCLLLRFVAGDERITGSISNALLPDTKQTRNTFIMVKLTIILVDIESAISGLHKKAPQGRGLILDMTNKIKPAANIAHTHILLRQHPCG